MSSQSDSNCSVKHPFEGIAYMRFLPRIAKQLPRAMAYTNEVAESFRYVIHPNIVRGAYGLAFGYIGIDTAIKVGYQMGPQMEFNKIAKYQLFDSCFWHGSASMILPSVAIHNGVKLTKAICKGMNASLRTSRIAPIVVGLGMIPLIVKPIDHGVDLFMDNYVRKMYPEDIKDKIIT